MRLLDVMPPLAAKSRLKTSRSTKKELHHAKAEAVVLSPAVPVYMDIVSYYVLGCSRNKKCKGRHIKETNIQGSV